MDYETEITSLHAETLAIQTILVQVLAQVAGADARMAEAVRTGFDEAANHVEELAIRFGKSASPEHTVKALRIVEELRTATVGNRDQPRHGV